MIGMMYLVLTAMLALNVSSEVLQGFSLVDKSLHSSIQSANVRMDALLGDFQSLYDLNPTKVKEWLDKAHVVEQQSDSLFDYIQNFKYQMIRLADGKDADPKAIEIEDKQLHQGERTIIAAKQIVGPLGNAGDIASHNDNHRKANDRRQIGPDKLAEKTSGFYHVPPLPYRASPWPHRATNTFCRFMGTISTSAWRACSSLTPPPRTAAVLCRPI